MLPKILWAECKNMALSPGGGAMVQNLMTAVALAIQAFMAGLYDAIRVGEEAFLDLLRNFAADILACVPVGKYGKPLYNQLNRLWTTTACETPCIEWDESLKKWMVWLRLRGPDEDYPEQYEVGGSPANPGESKEKAIRRTVKKKFGVGVKSFTFLPQATFPNREERGWYFHEVYVVEFDQTPVVNSPNVIRVPVDELPDNVCWHHRKFIIPSALAYCQNRQLHDAGEYLQRVALGLQEPDNGKGPNDPGMTRKAIASALSLKDPKTPMFMEMYDAFTPHATNVAAEGVGVRKYNGVVQVLLEQRPGSDKWYASKWAGLGVGFRISDVSEQSALDRLTAKEFKTPTRYEFVGFEIISNDPRGWYLCLLYLAFPESDPANGNWFPIDQLPENLVASHRDQILPKAIAAFKERYLRL